MTEDNIGEEISGWRPHRYVIVNDLTILQIDGLTDTRGQNDIPN